MSKSLIGYVLSLNKRLAIVLLILGGSMILATTLLALIGHDVTLGTINRVGTGIVMATGTVCWLQDNKNYK
jgi:hypothetical protein